MFGGKSFTLLRRTIVALAVFAIALSGCQRTATPTSPDVTLVVNPDIRDVPAGDTMALTVETSGQDLRFKWSVARGKLSALDTPAVLYTAPDSIGVDTVTVEVSSASGTTTKHVSFNIVVPPTATPAAVVTGQVCQYKEDWLTLGDRLFLRTADFNRLRLPIGTRVTVDVTVNGTPYQVSGLILEHTEGMIDCTFRLNEPTRKALGVDDDVRIKEVKSRPIRNFEITVESVPAPASGSESLEGKVCPHKKDFLKLGDRLFLRTAEFNHLRLPIGTKITVAVTINGTPHQVSGLILDHDEGMIDCTFRLNEPTRKALGVDDDVSIEEVDKRPIRDFQVTVKP